MKMTKGLSMLAALLFLPAILPAQEPVRFAFITDNHFSFGSRSVEDLRRCIADINGLDSLDFVLFGGDLTDFGTDAEIRAVKGMMDSLRCRYYVVAGNHDAKWSESGCNTFRQVFGYEHFDFEEKGWRFLGCNSGPDMRMAPALIPQESMEWLRSLEGGRKSIFINHYPQDTSVLNYFDVTRELKRVGVQFEIGGHWHRNCALSYDGIPAVLGRSSMTDRDKPAGYNIFLVYPDRVTVSERRLFPHSTVQFAPWYAQALSPVVDTVQYDADGIPASYPWMRYDVNGRYPAVKEIWKMREGSNIVAGFARSGANAWYTTASGGVRCIRIRDGKLLWSRDFSGKIFSTPAVRGRWLVFGCTDGRIYALDARSGKVRWTAQAAKSVLGSPVIFGETVFIGASDGRFRALALKTGRPVWTFDGVEGFVECRPWVDAQQVVFGSWANRLYSLDTRTGRLQWVWQCRKPSRMYSPAATWPVKSAGRIFIAVPDRKVYALDAATGEELFTADGGREAIGLSADGKRVYAKTMWNTSYAFPADVAVPEGGALPHGAECWRVRNGAHYEIGPSAIAECGGMVITPTDKGNLFALDSRDGSLQWYHKISIALVNPVEAWEEKGRVCILASTMDGAVTLLETPKIQ